MTHYGIEGKAMFASYEAYLEAMDDRQADYFANPNEGLYSPLDPDVERQCDVAADRRHWLAAGCPLPIVEREIAREPIADELPF